MMLIDLFEWINREKGRCHLKQWIKDCLGHKKPSKRTLVSIEDFSGDTTAKIICLNFLKEIKYNMDRNPKYREIVLHMEDYLTINKNKSHPLFKIKGFSSYLNNIKQDLLCSGKEIRKKPLFFSNITRLESIITHNIPDGSSIPLDYIDEHNVNEKIEIINHRTAYKLPMKPLKTDLPLFWCTVSGDITRMCKDREDKQNHIRNELGMYNTESGYLVEFRLSRDYIDTPKKPVFFDSGPNEYFNTTKPNLKYGKTRRLSDFTLSEYKEMVHQEKNWPYNREHRIIPLGILDAPPNADEKDRKNALKDMWKELTDFFPEIIQEILDL